MNSLNIQSHGTRTKPVPKLLNICKILLQNCYGVKYPYFVCEIKRENYDF